MARVALVAALCAYGLFANVHAVAYPRPGAPKSDHRPLPSADVGQPLFLTPLIESGQLDKARAAARVDPLPNAPDVESYAGLLTVYKTYNSNMFFWYFPHVNKSAPILLWLQGGPGGSSLFGLFCENGPYVIDNTSTTASLREYAWTKNYSVFYIDNPVGTGYSFTDDDRGYANNEVDVAANLFEALQQFFTLFVEQSKNEFYVSGESYAGKYIPAIGYKTYQEGAAAKYNLRGLIIGDGLIDPETQYAYSELLYQVGMLDENEADIYRTQELIGVDLIKKKDFVGALNVFTELLNLVNVSGSTNQYNYLRTAEPAELNYPNAYQVSDGVRKAIHVGNLTFNSGDKVSQHLQADVMDTVKPWFEVLMDKYRVLLYSGALDIIVGSPLTKNMITTFEWSGAMQWYNAPKRIWKVQPNDTEVAGYVRNVNDFYYAVVRGAGHLVPFNQGRAALDMINRFIRGQF